VAGGLAALHILPLHPVVAYAVVFIGSSAAYVWLSREILRTAVPGAALWALLGVAFALRLSFIASDPVGSDDAYRYLWDGKVQASGINPYRYAPDDPALAPLHSNLLPWAVNHPGTKTVYLPVAQWIFFLTYSVAGESLWALKVLLLAADAATAAGLFLLLAHLKQPRSTVLLYALCPLPILAFGLDGHVDGFGLPLLVFGLLDWIRGRSTRGLLLLGLSLAVKPVALVILPALFLDTPARSERLRVALIPGLVAAATFVPYTLGADPLEGLSQFTAHWLFNGSIFEAVHALIRDNQMARLVCAGGLAASLAALQFSRHGLVQKSAFSVFLLLLFSPVVHPWYVAWLAVLLPVVPLRSGVVFAATASLAVITQVGYRLTGEWQQHPVVLVAEYAPVLLLFAMEVTGRLRLPGASAPPPS
jgi:hypothetical protein